MITAGLEAPVPPPDEDELPEQADKIEDKISKYIKFFIIKFPFLKVIKVERKASIKTPSPLVQVVEIHHLIKF